MANNCGWWIIILNNGTCFSQQLVRVFAFALILRVLRCVANWLWQLLTDGTRARVSNSNCTAKEKIHSEQNWTKTVSISSNRNLGSLEKQSPPLEPQYTQLNLSTDCHCHCYCVRSAVSCYGVVHWLEPLGKYEMKQILSKSLPLNDKQIHLIDVNIRFTRERIRVINQINHIF